MRDFSSIDGVEVLERRNPQFEGGPTTGAVAQWRIGLHGDPQLNKLADGKIKSSPSSAPISAASAMER
jgi:hypothetical protein